MANIDFSSKRTKGCEDLMIPEARECLNLPLGEKIKKSQEIIKEALAKIKVLLTVYEVLLWFSQFFPDFLNGLYQ